jgi:hypothetical protein
VSPTGRTLNWLRREGFIVAVVEKWNPFAGIRQDVWGIADVLACHPRDRLILLVQTTSASNVSHRLQKARARPELAAWLRAGGTFEVHGWERRGKKWTLRRVAVRGEDLAAVTVQAVPRRGRRPRQRELFA